MFMRKMRAGYPHLSFGRGGRHQLVPASSTPVIVANKYPIVPSSIRRYKKMQPKGCALCIVITCETYGLCRWELERALGVYTTTDGQRVIDQPQLGSIGSTQTHTRDKIKKKHIFSSRESQADAAAGCGQRQMIGLVPSFYTHIYVTHI